MMAEFHSGQSVQIYTSEDKQQYNTAPRVTEAPDVESLINTNASEYSTEHSTLEANTLHELTQEEIYNSLEELIVQEGNNSTVTVHETLNQNVPVSDEHHTPSNNNNNTFDILLALRNEDLVDLVKEDPNNLQKYLDAQRKLSNLPLVNTSDIDHIQHLLIKVGIPNKFKLPIDIEQVLEAQDWYQGDLREILFWHEGFHINTFVESCRRSSYKKPVIVPYVVVGTRLTRRHHFRNAMASMLKKAYDSLYHNVELMDSNIISQDFYAAVKNMYHDQYESHNSTFDEEILYHVDVIMDTQRPNMLRQHVENMGLLLLDTCMNMKREDEARESQDGMTSGKILPSLFQNQRSLQTQKAMYYNFEFGESIRNSWNHLQSLNPSQCDSYIQKMTDASRADVTPLEIKDVEDAATQIRKRKSSSKKKKNKNKNKSKLLSEVEQSIFKGTQGDRNTDNTEADGFAAIDIKEADNTDGRAAAKDDSLVEQHFMFNALVVNHLEGFSKDDGKTIIRSISQTENVFTKHDQENAFSFGKVSKNIPTPTPEVIATTQQNQENPTPLAKASTKFEDATIESNALSRPRGRSITIRTKSMTDAEISEVIIRDESIVTARKRLQEDMPVPNSNSTEQAKTEAQARTVRANSISIIRKRTMSRTTNRPNLAELRATAELLDSKDSALVEGGDGFSSSENFSEAPKSLQVVEIETSLETPREISIQSSRTLYNDESTGEIMEVDNKSTASESGDSQLLDTSDQNLHSKQRRVAPLPETQAVFRIEPRSTPKKKGKSKKKSKGKGKKGPESAKATESELATQQHANDIAEKLSLEAKYIRRLNSPNIESSVVMPLEIEISQSEAPKYITEVEEDAHTKTISETDISQTGRKSLPMDSQQADSISGDLTNTNIIANNANVATQDISGVIDVADFSGPKQFVDKQVATVENKLMETPNAKHHAETQKSKVGDSAEPISVLVRRSEVECGDYDTLPQVALTRLIDEMPKEPTEVRDARLNKTRAISAQVEVTEGSATSDMRPRSKSVAVDIVVEFLSAKNHRECDDDLSVSVKDKHQGSNGGQQSVSTNDEVQEHDGGKQEYMDTLAACAATDSKVNSFMSSNYRCAYCNIRTSDNHHIPSAIICPGCGPCSSVRYCSRACALLDSYKHFQICTRTFENYTVSWEQLPLKYHELLPAIIPSGNLQSAELFRQMAFSWYAHDDDGSPIRLIQKWGEQNIPSEDYAEFLSNFGPEGPQIQELGDYFIYRSLTVDDPTSTATFVCLKFYQKDEFNRVMNCCILDKNQYKLSEFLYRMIWYELSRPGGVMDSNPEEANNMSYEFQNQFWLEFGFAPAQCKDKRSYDFEIEWEEVKDIVDHMERSYPMLRAWRRDGPTDQISQNGWDRFFGKEWPKSYDKKGKIKDTFVPDDTRPYFHQGWTGHCPLPNILLKDRLM